MSNHKTCKCGKRSVPGLRKGIALCQYHYNVTAFGQIWADRVTAKAMTLKQQIEQRLQSDQSTLRRGWHLDGAGPARYGWGACYASGKVSWLGETLLEAATRLGIETK